MYTRSLKLLIYISLTENCFKINCACKLTLFIKILIISRPVTQADVLSIEKKLLQTMDMILVKKKRIALAENNSMGRNQYMLDQSNSKNKGFWTNILSSVGNIANPLSQGSESKCYCNRFQMYHSILCHICHK